MASSRMVKRESGENPEQTRCCKLRLRAEQTPFATETPPNLPTREESTSIRGWRNVSGRRSEHGSKSEDLPKWISE